MVDSIFVAKSSGKSSIGTVADILNMHIIFCIKISVI